MLLYSLRVCCTGERRLRKERLQAQYQCYSWIRWALVAALLLLLALGLVYYITRIHHAPEGRGERERERETPTNTGRKTGRSKKAEKSGDKKRDMKSSGSQKKASSAPPDKSSRQKPKKSRKRGVETVAMEDVRLLRRPVARDDADRPYIIEILNGDNLLLEERYSEALEKFNEVLKMFPQSPRGLYGKGESLVGLANQKSSNKLMDTAVEFYQDTAKSFLATKDLKVS